MQGPQSPFNKCCLTCVRVLRVISAAAKKHGVKIESAKKEAGERVYRIGK
jgi:hypothetical protein